MIIKAILFYSNEERGLQWGVFLTLDRNKIKNEKPIENTSKKQDKNGP